MKKITYEYIIEGEPIPLRRPRFGDGKCFDSQRNMKRETAGYLNQQHWNRQLITKPISMIINFYFKYPTSFSKEKRSHGPIPKDTRCDLDNCIKYICDVGNDVIWSDDALIYEIHAAKYYDVNSRTEFTITF